LYLYCFSKSGLCLFAVTEQMSASTSQNKISGSGIVCRVEESFAFISSKRYGSIYVPGSVMIAEGDDSHGDLAISSKLRVDDVVHFKAINQFGPKDCQWMAVSLKKSAKQALANSSLPSIISNQIGLIVDIHDRTMFIYNETYGEIYYPLGAHLAYLQELKMGSEEVVYASFMETFYNNQTVLFNAIRQTEVNDCAYVATAVWPANEQITGEMNVMSEIGNIVKLSSHYGYILSESLGQVFFSISNCENYTSPELTLFDLFEVNDLVHFNPMKQPEMNGCNWRALNVMKFQFAAEENPLWDNVVQDYQFENDQFSISNSNATVRVDVENSKPPKTTVDKACQTVTPPEMFLLKAVTADPTFYMELHRNFPHLMKFIDKACFQYFLCCFVTARRGWLSIDQQTLAQEASDCLDFLLPPKWVSLSQVFLRLISAIVSSLISLICILVPMAALSQGICRGCTTVHNSVMNLINNKPRLHDILCWKDPVASGVIFAILFITLISLRYFSALLIIAYAGLLALAASLGFRLYSLVTARLYGKEHVDPFKPYLENTISFPAERLHSQVDVFVDFIQKFLDNLKRLFLLEKIFESLKLFVMLWSLTYVGSWLSLSSLAVLALIYAFTVPLLLEKHGNTINKYKNMVTAKVDTILKTVDAKMPFLHLIHSEEKKKQQ
ncbi:Reticulon-3, partial [Trichinella sp. T6]